VVAARPGRRVAGGASRSDGVRSEGRSMPARI